jgi:hypothetical protein
MEIETIASLSVALLAPYLEKMGSATAEKLGEIAPEKIGELYKAVKQKFAGDEDAEMVLESAEKRPASKGRSQALVEVVEEKMKEDDDFAGLMMKLVTEIQPTRQGDHIEQKINVSGKSGDIFQIGSMKGNDIGIRSKAD